MDDVTERADREPRPRDRNGNPVPAYQLAHRDVGPARVVRIPRGKSVRLSTTNRGVFLEVTTRDGPRNIHVPLRVVHPEDRARLEADPRRDFPVMRLQIWFLRKYGVRWSQKRRAR